MHFPVRPEGQPADGAARMTVRLADAGFFRTLRIPVTIGRAFDGSDRENGTPVAVINRSAAERLDATGPSAQRIQIAARSAPEIVGVVADIKHGGLNAVEGPVIYVPLAQASFAFVNWMGIVVRGPTSTMAASVKAAVARVDPNQPITAVQSMDKDVEQETAPFRFGSLIVGSLAVAAYILASDGHLRLDGVHRRTTIAGSRRAARSGATRRSIVQLVFRQVAVTLAAGSLVGLAAGLATNGMLKRGSSPNLPGDAREVIAVIGSGLLVAVTAVIAGLGPALRAARMESEDRAADRIGCEITRSPALRGARRPPLLSQRL